MSTTIGYAARLEQAAPSHAVELAMRAETAGFEAVMVGDHFQPWVPQQGQAGFLWPVLGAMGARTMGQLGAVTTPGYRVHPAVVAHAAATVAEMYPGRCWVGIGSGEALSEHIVGQYWPEPAERIARMFEAVDLITRLLGSRDRDVRLAGKYFTLESSRLWTAPPVPPPVLIATSGPATARRAGRSADGIVTVEPDPRRLAGLLHRLEQGARDSGRDITSMRRVVQLRVSWGRTDADAEEQALAQWPNAGLRFPTADLRSPFLIAQAARGVTVADLRDRMLMSADPQLHLAAIQRLIDLGFTDVYVHHVGVNQKEFLDAYGEHVLPKIRR
ncbi:MAG: TIGR03557 family F420-dependent LLM class oxidoreductase [Nostocoides sp.]